MKHRFAFILLLVLVFAMRASAQETGDATQTLENLRLQLSDVQDQEVALKIRLDQLDLDLKPENIERYFNGFGSTRPEELRESRRRQLQTEKDRVVVQLDQLAASRGRLEVAVANAQARVYQQSALGATVMQSAKYHAAHLLTAMRVAVGGIVLVVFLSGMALLLVHHRRRRPIARLGGIIDEPWCNPLQKQDH